MTDFDASFNDAIQNAGASVPPPPTGGQTSNRPTTTSTPPAPAPTGSSGGGGFNNMDSAYVTALQQLIAAGRSAGHTITISDGWRDYTTQQRAYESFKADGTNLAGQTVPSIAAPGRSRHEVGLAADLSGGGAAGQAWLHANAPSFNISFDVSNEPWHAVWAGTPSKKTTDGATVPGWNTYVGSLPEGTPSIAQFSGGTADPGVGPTPVTGPVTGDTSGNAVVDNFDGTVPKDLVVLNVAGGQTVVGYEISPGVWGTWDGPGVNAVNGVRSFNLTAEAFEQLTTVRLGDVSELDDLSGSYDTFKEFIDEWIFVAGVNRESLSDPTVAEVFLKTVSDPSLLDQPGVIDRMLQESEWFQGRTNRALQWNDGSLSRAQKEEMIDTEIGNVKSEVYRYLGQNIAFNDPKLREWAEQIASGQATLSKIINTEIKPMSESQADSPWSRTLRDEERAQLQRGVDYEDEAARIRASATRWGVTMSEDELLSWGRKITEGIYSRDDLAEMLKDQAQALYPWKSREVETATAAQPYLQAFNSTFEVTGTDVFSPEIQTAMQQGVTVTDFAQELRNSERWLSTENGRDEILSIGSQISRQMGFN